MDKAVSLCREALALQDLSHPDRSTFLNNLSFAISGRFQQRGDPKDIDEAVALCREALALRAPPHPDQSHSLNNLAFAVLTRFDHQGGDPKGIDESIILYREALTLRAHPHPQRSISLNNLSGAILLRFEQRGDPKDIDESIALYTEALALRAPPHPDRSNALHDLAAAILTRFGQRGDPKDIDESIAHYREALALRVPPNPNRSHALYNLANAVSMRFEQRGDPKDIDECIALYREALALQVSPHPGRSICLNGLARAVSARFKPEDSDVAVALHREALTLQAPPHPHRSQSLMNLGFTLVKVHKHKPNQNLLHDAISAFQEASTYSNSSLLARFDASHLWAATAAQHGHSSSLDGFRQTILLLPQLAAFHLDLNSRQKMLTKRQITSLASNAATCAIDLCAYNVAVEFLEASRSIFWAQALHLRTPLYHLKTVNPGLPSKIEELSRKLEVASFRDTSLVGNPSEETQCTVISIEAEGVRCRELNEEWESVINSVRELPTFEDFMRPKNMVTLRQAAASGPVIIIIAKGLTSSALVVTTTGDVQCVHLPEISHPVVKIYAEIFRALSNSTFDINTFFENRAQGDHAGDWSESATRLFGSREGWVNMSPDAVFRVLLRLLWAQIVKPVFNSLNLEASNSFLFIICH
jgi:tetratricopeptide (TPR) repeat protein